jgi:hypothetical protein
MKTDILKNYVKLRSSLEQERSKLQARLTELDAALGIEISVTAQGRVQAAAGPTPKRKLSAANKAKLIAGIKARWAKYRAEKAGQAPKKGPGRPKGSRGKLSAAGRAAIVAAQKARWAKKKGLVAPTPGKKVPAPAKPRRKVSAAGRKAISAAAKARWAKARAEKAGKTEL